MRIDVISISQDSGDSPISVPEEVELDYHRFQIGGYRARTTSFPFFNGVSTPEFCLTLSLTSIKRPVVK
jgi:hypothetical protein